MKKLALCALLLAPSCATAGWLVSEALPPLLASPALAEAAHKDLIAGVKWALHLIPYGDILSPYIEEILNHAPDSEEFE